MNARLVCNAAPSPIDDRDYPYVSPFRPEDLAHKLDWSAFVRHIEDQMYIGACATNAVGAYGEMFLKWAGCEDDLARLFLYQVVRKYEGRLDQEGCVLRDALKMARKYGMPSESIYPYIPEKENDEPPPEVFAAAAERKIERYECVVPIGCSLEPSERLFHIKSALNEGLPVVIAMQVGAAIFGLEGNWYNQFYPTLNAPGNEPAGGHAMVFVGYDDFHGKFKVLNSWGEQWGDKGYLGLPYSAIHIPFFEAWVIRGIDGIEIPERPGIKLEEQNRFRIEARIVPKPEEVGAEVRIWVGALIEGVWYLKTGNCRPRGAFDGSGDTWEIFDGVNLNHCDSLVLAESNLLQVVNWLDLSPFVGGEVFMAYGTSPLDWTLKKLCTIQVST